MSLIACTVCGMPYPEDTNPFICECGGVFDYQDFPKFDPQKSNIKGVWAYSTSLGHSAGAPIISLGEGGTPLIPVTIANRQVWLKLESANPTGSYKDRGSTTLVSHLKSRGVDYVIEDSSGNAGASFAAYCARAGLRCKVFVPESASGPKRTQIEMFGAQLVRVPGPRSEAAKAALHEAKTGAVYGSHAYMPFGLTGIATLAYELVEQLGETPAAVIAPVGHGGLLYGIMRGFEAMKTAGVIDHEPFYVGVQSEACAPITLGFLKTSSMPQVVSPQETIAEGVKVTTPVRGGAILARMKQERGIMIAVSEKLLWNAYLEMAHLGVYCEPTSALVWAASSMVEEKNKAATVAIITGSGYKSIPIQKGIV